MQPAQFGIFAKEARPGRVKTRLAARIGETRAASLYTAMLADTVTLLTKVSTAPGLLFYDGLRPTAVPAGWICHPQGPGSLGQRLDRAAQEANSRPLIFLGSDSPDLPPKHLERASTALVSADIALGPARDGGVWCIGLARPIAGLFENLPWSSPATGEALRNRARQLGLNLAELPAWRDVDELPDLLALATRLVNHPERAPRTQQWLLHHPGPWRSRWPDSVGVT